MLVMGILTMVISHPTLSLDNRFMFGYMEVRWLDSHTMETSF
jgi:hypothetical protein